LHCRENWKNLSMSVLTICKRCTIEITDCDIFCYLLERISKSCSLQHTIHR
jgi:hypothetical protein